MKTSRLALMATVCALLAGVAPRAGAQDRVAASLEQLARIVGPGSDITVIDRDGTRLSGFITALTPVDLTVFVDGAPRMFTETDVLRIEERRHDSLLNGALLGFGIGAGSAVGMTLIAKAANYYIHEDKVARNILTFGACGAGVGVLVDALHKRRAIVYDATRRLHAVDYQVQVSRTVKSASVVLRF